MPEISEPETCPKCCMAIVDDLHRTPPGTAWHLACFTEWVDSWFAAARERREADRGR